MKKEKIFAYALENAILHQGKAQINAVLGKLFADGLKKSDMKEVMPIIQECVKEVNRLSLQEQDAKFEDSKELVKLREHKEREGLPELEIDQKPVFRFSPFPSGPLHIGNARQAVLNGEYSKKYNGKFILIFDDTIGSEEKPVIKEAYQMILDNFRYLGINPDEVFYKSDRLNIYYEHALKLISRDKAYICKCSPDLLRKNRENKKECVCRKNSVDENLKLWQWMLNEGRENESTLRIKTDIKDKNPAFRDRVLFRISERKHARVKSRYRVWPLLDFSMAIDDHLLGITHIIRGKELMIEGEMEKYIWDIFKWKHPAIIYTGLMNINGIKLSKSKSSHEIKSGKYIGWDDPRTFSLQSLEKRGIKAEALKSFIIRLGINQNEISVPIESLYDENKVFVEKSDRYFFVNNPVKIKIKNAPALKAELPLHPLDNHRFRVMETKDEFYIAGEDKKELKKGGNFRFMNLFNFSKMKFISIEKDLFLKPKALHWLPVQENLVKTRILMLNGEYAKGLSEPDVENIKVGDVIQFERFGFCRLIKKDSEYEFWFAHK